MTQTNLEGRVVLITGANRGIGRALVAAALDRGATHIYAGARQPFTPPDARVTVLPLDVTDAASIAAARARIAKLDVLVNNAGQARYDDLRDRRALDELLAINLYGTHAMTQTFAPLLTNTRGAVVNILSALALAPLPLMAAYSVSKAAAFSLTQAQRALFAADGVRVHAVLTGPVDTDMTRDLPVPKCTPAEVADGIWQGVLRGEEEIFPDVMSQQLADGWRSGVAKALEKQNAPFVPAAAHGRVA